jgi:hypothetical protein
MSRDTPTRYTKGVGTAVKNTALGEFGLPAPTRYHMYFNDFDTFAAGDWTITTTEAGAGSATEAVTDKDGGALLLTNAAGDNDLDNLQLAGESFAMAAGKQAWFSARFQVSDATQSDIFMGLIIKTATDPVGTAPTDGIFFRKDDGDTNVDFVVTKDSTATTASAVTTMSDATDIELAFHYDGVDTITYFVDDVRTGTSVTTNLPDDEVLSVMMHIQNGEAAAKTMTVDWIMAAKER